MRPFVSLGGWCGPALLAAKLDLPRFAFPLPFDKARCTLDGVVHFLRRRSFDGFLPPPSSIMDPAGIWLLFRTWHTCFTHVDYNDVRVRNQVQREIDNWFSLVGVDPDRTRFARLDSNAALWGIVPTGTDTTRAVHDDATTPATLTFVRTCIAEDPLDEVRSLDALEESLSTLNPRLDFRTILVVHGQDVDKMRQALRGYPLRPTPTVHSAVLPRVLFTNRAEPLAVPLLRTKSARTVVWAVACDPDVPSSASLFDRTHDGYAQILQQCATSDSWSSVANSVGETDTVIQRALPWARYSDLSRVAGVPAFRGTCTGFGSTLAETTGMCLYCGSTDGHAVADRRRHDTEAPWDEDHDERLVEAYVECGGDVVMAVERCANMTGRGANETLERLTALVKPHE